MRYNQPFDHNEIRARKLARVRATIQAKADELKRCSVTEPMRLGPMNTDVFGAVLAESRRT